MQEVIEHARSHLDRLLRSKNGYQALVTADGTPIDVQALIKAASLGYAAIEDIPVTATGAPVKAAAPPINDGPIDGTPVVTANENTPAVAGNDHREDVPAVIGNDNGKDTSAVVGNGHREDIFSDITAIENKEDTS